MAKPKEINAGDKVLVRQKKCTTKPPFNPEPLTITNTIGNQVHAIKKDRTVKFRDKNQLKKVNERPQHLSVSHSSANCFNFDIQGNFVTKTELDSLEETQGEVAEQLFSFANNEQSEQIPVTLPDCQQEAEHVIPGQSCLILNLP